MPKVQSLCVSLIILLIPAGIFADRWEEYHYCYPGDITAITHSPFYVFVGTSSGLLCSYDRLKGRWELSHSIGERILGLLWLESEGCLVVHCPGKIAYYYPWKKQWGEDRDIAGVRVEEVLRVGATWGNLYCELRSGGLYAKSHTNLGWRKVSTFPQDVYWARNDTPREYTFLAPYYVLDEAGYRHYYRVCEEVDDRLWVGTQGFGVFCFSVPGGIDKLHFLLGPSGVWVRVMSASPSVLLGGGKGWLSVKRGNVWEWYDERVRKCGEVRCGDVYGSAWVVGCDKGLIVQEQDRVLTLDRVDTLGLSGVRGVGITDEGLWVLTRHYFALLRGRKLVECVPIKGKNLVVSKQDVWVLADSLLLHKAYGEPGFSTFTLEERFGAIGADKGGGLWCAPRVGGSLLHYRWDNSVKTLGCKGFIAREVVDVDGIGDSVAVITKDRIFLWDRRRWKRLYFKEKVFHPLTTVELLDKEVLVGTGRGIVRLVRVQ